MRRGLAAIGAVAILAVAGCYLPGDDTGINHGFGAENRSSQTVDIEYTARNGEKFIVVRDLLAYAGRP